jgi:cell wall-associated NlpC family hydrolase
MVAMVGALLFSMLTPLVAFADTNLVIGGTARVAFADGDDVMLRSDPGYDAKVLAHVAEGSTVDVLDGPVAASDGTLWYKVSANGKTGYIVSLYLALDDGGSSDSAPADSPPNDDTSSSDDTSSGAAAAPVTGTAIIAGTNNDGVLCRTEASSDAAVIGVIPEGTKVELTGPQVDIWQPVNCKGRAGFVHAQYVSLDGSVPTQAPAEDDTSASTETGGVTGTGEIYNTNGDGIRCRAGAGSDKNVITVLTEGEHVDLRGTSNTDWQPVFCGGRKGFIHKDFVKVGGSADTGTSSDDSTFSASATGTATVTGTNGGGLRCRSAASFDGSIITVLAEGTKVSLRGTARSGWQPVTCKSRNGYVSTDYISYSGGGGSGSPTSDDSTSGGITITGTAHVKTDDGSGLNCRAGAGFDKRILTVLPNGSKIDLRGVGYSDWQPVVCLGRRAYVLKMYVDFGNGTSSGNNSGNTGNNTSNSDLSAGDWAKVSGTNGAGVRFRSGASTNASIISVLAEGTKVKVRSGSSSDWVAVTYNGSNGYVHKDYLVKSSAPSSGNNSGNSGGDSNSGYRFGNGDHVKTTTSLNLRYSPSFSGGVAAVAPAGTVVLVTGSPTHGFYPVDWDGLKGYMYTTYLIATSAALSDRGGSAQDPSDGDSSSNSGGDGGSGSATGNSIVAYAMQYKGYPYVWATHGPGSFDCSGFTYWVALNVLGINIGAGLYTQVAAGTPVSRNSLKPGDLVFFQNTYTWGLSHVGIYIGNDQFIHAENESTGVTISSLKSQYYASRWYGAVRLG